MVTRFFSKIFRFEPQDGLEGSTTPTDRNACSWFAAPSQHFQVISPGRSGTRWLANVLLESTKSLVIHATPKTLAEPGFLYHQGRISDDEILGAYRQSRSFHLELARTSNRPLFDLDCKNTPITKILVENYPSLRFIIQIRDPIAFVKSGIIRGYYSSKDPQAWGHLIAANNNSTKHKTESERIIFNIADFWRQTVLIASATYQNYQERVFFLDMSKIFNDPTVVNSLLDDLKISHLNTSSVRAFRQQSNKNWRSSPISIEQQQVLSSTIFRDYCFHDIPQSIVERAGWLN